MKRLIGIMADDLTGANDSGVQLTKGGVDTSVFLDLPEDEESLTNGIVINTNARSLSKEGAISVTQQVGEYLKRAGYLHIYKKMDSTLRGHIGAELQTIYKVFKPEFIFIAPAFPAMGRTTSHGIHYVNGVEINRTEFANDPKDPVTDSFIPAIIKKEIGQPVGLLTKADIDAPKPIFSEKINHFKKTGINYIVCDADTQIDLEKAAYKMADIAEDIIWSGSAGLAEVLPKVLGIMHNSSHHSFAPARQVITVSGSLSQITQQQIEYMKKRLTITAIELNTLDFFTNDWEKIRQNYIERSIDGLKQGNDLILYLPSNQKIRDKVKQIGIQLNLTSNQISERISHSIGEIVAKVMSLSDDLIGLVLIGGDTAKVTCHHLGGIGFRLIKQIENGIPLGTLIGTDKEITVVTKAGAFGNVKSIDHAIQKLKGV